MQNRIVIAALAAALGVGFAQAKLPAPSEEQKAKAAETKAKSAEGAKKRAEALAKAQDQVAQRYAAMKAKR